MSREIIKTTAGKICGVEANNILAFKGIPKWVTYTTEWRTTMIFDVPCRIETDPYREELDAWEGIEFFP